MQIALQFLGGAGTVTGSKILVEAGERRFLVDCGLFQGLKDLRLRNWAPCSIDVGHLDAVLLTHAHLDHCGYLPVLVREGFRGPIYCTPPTRDLAKLILADSAKILEEDAEIANTLGFSRHQPARPLYTSTEAHRVTRQFENAPVANWIDLGDGIRARFERNGHIIGSAFIVLDLAGTRIVFSGDLGRSDPLVLCPSEPIPDAEYIVVESTYGDRVHSPISPLRELARVVNQTVDRDGHLIIPSFAVGRTQDLLYMFAQLKEASQIPNLPIFVDSPMGVTATEIFLDYPDWHRLSAREIEALSNAATLVRSGQQSEEVMARRESTVVIAGSGMVSGGRVLSHLKRRLTDSRNTVLLVGFQAASTRGRLLQDGIDELKIHGEYVPVQAKIETISGLSAHADQRELIQWLAEFRATPRGVFIVHGEPQASDALRVRIKDRLNWRATIPQLGERIVLR